MRMRRRRAHNTAERSRETRHQTGAVPATGMAVRRGSVRTARRREGVLRQVRRRTLPHRDSRQLERRARALRSRLRGQPGAERIQPARRQPHHPRTSRPRRIRLGRVELPVQRLRARARSRRHDGARRAVHEIERRPRTAAHVSDRHVDGRTRHDSRSARISNRVCRRSRDVSRWTGVVRLLRRRRRRRRSDYRRRVQVRFDPAGHGEDRRAIGRAARLHGKGTPTRQRTANISGSALAGIVTPQNRAVTTTHIRYAIDGGLGLTSDSLNQRVRRKTADPEYRGDKTPYEEVAPFDGRIERPLLTMHGTGDLFVPIFLQQVLKRAVAATGNEKLLAQRIYRIAGHCGFSQTEQIRAFDDLVKWVRQGTKPDGDEVEGDLSNAGMTFTDPLRPNDPGGLTIKPAPSSAPQAGVDFVRDVQPIFRQNCYGCHGPSIHQNGFRLDRRADAMRGGTGPVIGRGDSAASRLYQRLIGNRFGMQMPPTGPLAAEQIAAIKEWIDRGAEWPDEAAGETPALPTPPLMRAVLYSDVAEVQRLLDEGADPDATNDAGATALMWSAGDDAKTRLLLEYGADPNIQSDHGKTALFVAAGRRGGASVVKMLLDYGASASLKAGRLNNPTSALVEAANVGDAATVRLLLDHGASVTDAGFVAAAFALRAHCLECFDLLARALDKGTLSMTGLVITPPAGDSRALSTLLDRG
ncbi:MAG: hypothetical protein DMF99_13505 [Acidobacteria bacterium]|nr:MAG: hypothetical protein DMF99_13505 [Acidobacteriota bacterium]